MGALSVPKSSAVHSYGTHKPKKIPNGSLSSMNSTYLLVSESIHSSYLPRSFRSLPEKRISYASSSPFLVKLLVNSLYFRAHPTALPNYPINV